LLIAAVSAGMMFFGGPLIALFPKPVLGGLLIFLGLSFLADWLYDGWNKLSRADYVIVVVIFLVMSLFGLLPGLGVGVALAAGLFIIQYSRVPVVRRTVSGRTYRSRVETFPAACRAVAPGRSGAAYHGTARLCLFWHRQPRVRSDQGTPAIGAGQPARS